MKKNRLVFAALTGLLISSAFAAKPATTPSAYTSTSTTLKDITPENELKRLIAGNQRFVKNNPINRDFIRQAKVTSKKGQFPAAIILSCMDSRGSAELVFDQGIGDVFSIRVAGNVVDTDQLGSMEYATKAVGTKLVVVMGHTHCGAVTGACNGVELGQLTALLEKIKPAVAKVKEASTEAVSCSNNVDVNHMAKQNVLDMMQVVKEKSSIINDQLSKKQIMLVGAMQDLRTGQITFFDESGKEIS